MARWSLPADSRAPVRDMAYATVRRLGTAQSILARLASRPIAPPLAAILHTALVQLIDPVRPPAIIVDQAVAAVRGTARNPRQAASEGGFANAILRRFQREREPLLAALYRESHLGQTDPDWPSWWVLQLRQDYPEQWRELLRGAAQTPPLTLRVDQSRLSLDAYLSVLEAHGMAACQVGPQAIRLERACPVDRIPGFAQGLVSVQDAGAQLAASLLGVESGQRVLDACAAPGGKSVHLLELAAVELVALDVDAQRLQRVRANLERCGFAVAHEERPGDQPRRGVPTGPGDPVPFGPRPVATLLPLAEGAVEGAVEGAFKGAIDGCAIRAPRPAVQLRAADAAQPERWWDGRAFDRILLDAPCSASGIVRRHPDIRWLRRRGDLATLAATQRRLLDALWPLLAPGGRLLYVTCSVFQAENEAVVRAFVEATADCQRLALQWSFSSGPPESLAQLLPVVSGQRDHDGFFYALLARAAVAPTSPTP
ncbi:MAG: 16S rRNA (cytosine(967)-C(5))-methyltransferase RsmB [Betaproteobacteria bacterium]|nr:16S rRNA (cytosine(967)-C(5))-methyltransferase RsmB [Betaproteobacteria bacterium]